MLLVSAANANALYLHFHSVLELRPEEYHNHRVREIDNSLLLSFPELLLASNVISFGLILPAYPLLLMISYDLLSLMTVRINAQKPTVSSILIWYGFKPTRNGTIASAKV